MSRELQTLAGLLVLCAWATRCWTGPRVDLAVLWPGLFLGAPLPPAARTSIRIGPHTFDLYAGSVIVHHLAGGQSVIYALDVATLKRRLGGQFTAALQRLHAATGVDLGE